MPRIGATLAAFALIACSIAVNISRYPVVWEMATPATHLPPSPQAAHSEPAEDTGDAPDSTTSLALASTTPDPEKTIPGRSYSVAERDEPTCSADGAYCYRAPQHERSDYAWGEDSYAAQSPQDDVPMVAAEIVGTKPEETAKTGWGRAARAEPDSYRDSDSFAYHPEPAPYEAVASNDDATAGFADPSEPATANVLPKHDAGADYSYDSGFAGAEQVEPEGPYAGSAPAPNAEYSGGFSTSAGGYAADDDPQSATWPAEESGRRIVPVVPRDAAAAPDTGNEMAATIGAPFGFRSEVRRLPSIDEVNPFLNDGYDPPAPDISRMNYPSTDAQ